MANQPLSSGMTGLSRDGAILAEVLKQLATIQETLSHVAKQEDLKDFTRQDQFTSATASIAGRFDDHAARLTRLETKQEGLQDRFHQAEVAEAQKFAGIQVAGAQQIGQAQVAGAQQVMGLQSHTSEWQSKLLFSIIGALSTGFMGMLVYVVTHLR